MATVEQPNKIWRDRLVFLIIGVRFSESLAGMVDWWWPEEAVGRVGNLCFAYNSMESEDMKVILRFLDSA